MTLNNKSGYSRSRLSAALVAAMLMPAAGTVLAQDQTNPDQTASSTDAKTLDKVVVTGSLIPQTEKETYKPVLVITAEDIKTKGYTSVADALQRASFATGGVQGSQTSASFTQGAETNSLFGLNPGYTKYLIDGRPMANYPALYNGSDVFNNISGIPADLVERIEILPGGQSSLYGSDAIAGVINIILKKKIDGSTLDLRVGDYTDGGGGGVRASFATSISAADDRWNTIFGAQFEKTDPIWGYGPDRDLTNRFHNGITGTASTYPISDPATASRDFLVYSPFTSYKFLDPANCANVTSGFNGTEGLQTRPGFGDEKYCGSLYSPGYATLKNGKESAQLYAHSTFDINDKTQLYADVLLNHETVRYHTGAGFTWWGTSVEWGYYFDPRVGNDALDAYGVEGIPGSLLNLQRGFMPEDMGSWNRSMNKDVTNSYSLSLGVNGTFGNSNWDYDFGATRTEYKLTEHGWARLAGPINDWFQQNILGPQLGLDPLFGVYPVFEPDYAKFYQLLTPEIMNSFTTFTTTNSKTYDNMYRAQVTNGSLFQLPGGDAGLALVLEGGNQGWDYSPDPRLLDGEVWGTTAVSGHGSRSRYAATGELRLPLFDPLTLSLSGRYDSYTTEGATLHKPTYNVGFEYRPVQSLLFRGQYGTAFKVPSLADLLQGLSGFYSGTIDYLNCYRSGFDPGAVSQCPTRYSNLQYFGQTSGNPDLQPITAKVWSYGVVWAPTPKFSIGVDYHHWDINNEVANQDVNQLMLDELNCTSVADGGTGTLDPASGTCQAAFSQIHRNDGGTVDYIQVQKVNVAKEKLNALTLDVHYLQSIGNAGDLRFAVSATRNLTHEQKTYPGDPNIDLLVHPYYSTDPRDKANASVTWSKDAWSVTLFADYMGPTPNYRSTLTAPGTIDKASGNDVGEYNYPGAWKMGSYTTYNASVSYDITPDFNLSFLANNLTNKYPDMDLSYPGTTDGPFNSSNYNAFGRSIYLEARWNFGKSKE